MKEEMKKDFEKLYGELYDTINKIKNSNNRRKLKENDDLEYSRFTAMHGSEYWKDKDGKEKDIRFMLVGRAVNGWGEYSGEDDSKDSFVESSMANLTNDKKSFSKNQKNKGCY